jgi:hypothetical protein
MRLFFWRLDVSRGSSVAEVSVILTAGIFFFFSWRGHIRKFFLQLLKMQVQHSDRDVSLRMVLIPQGWLII